LIADLEMHAFRDGYIGLCRLPQGIVNICGLFRRHAGAPVSPHPRELLRGPSGSSLDRRMTDAALDESSFCAVAGFSLDAARAAEQRECRIGDALTMIPPVTGNGMSMAFESAAAAIEPLVAYSRGATNWTETQASIATSCDQAFGKRLRWAAWLQRMMFCPALQGRFAALALRSDWLWRAMFSHTR
jgi:2-polyprenyl-6-methoxyphenol hydroxylase-like FAD-dependent oxidoreductase